MAERSSAVTISARAGPISSAGLSYGDDGPAIRSIWSLAASGSALFAGVEPAGLFRSEDGGTTWAHVEGLTNHPTRETWQPGAGGLILHTIVPHPTDLARTWIGISAVGVFETRDGGLSWGPRNRGVRADFMPDPHPITGQCVHKFAPAAGDPSARSGHGLGDPTQRRRPGPLHAGGSRRSLANP